MAADTKLARQHWKEHKHNSWLFFVILLVITLIISAIGMRFLKPPAVISALITLGVVQMMIFLNSGRIVIWLMGCKEPNEEQAARLMPLFEKLVERTPLKRAPTLFIAQMDVPNAFAFGTGIMGGSGVALTVPIIEILDDEELEAVMAHELGHIVSRDTALMTVISVTLSVLNKFTQNMANIGRLALAAAIALELVAYLPRVVASGITQLREYAADAYSAHITGKVQPLISAFEKMRAWHEKKAPKQKDPLSMLKHRQMDELLLSHPNMSDRIRMLKQLEKSQ